MKRLFVIVLFALASASISRPQTSIPSGTISNFSVPVVYLNCDFEDGSLCGGTTEVDWSHGAQVTNCQISSNVATITAANNGSVFHVGDFVSFRDLTHCPALNGTGFNPTSVSATTIVGNFSTADVASGAETGVVDRNEGTCNTPDARCDQWRAQNITGSAHSGTHYIDVMDTWGQARTGTFAGQAWKTVLRYTFGSGSLTALPYQPETFPGMLYVRFWMKLDTPWFSCMDTGNGASATQTKICLMRDGQNSHGMAEPIYGISQSGVSGHNWNFQPDNGDGSNGNAPNNIFTAVDNVWTGYAFKFSRAASGDTTFSVWHNAGAGWVQDLNNHVTGPSTGQAGNLIGSTLTSGSVLNGMYLDIGGATIQPSNTAFPCTPGNAHIGIDDVYAGSAPPPGDGIQ